MMSTLTDLYKCTDDVIVVVIDIFNLLSLSLSLALANKLQINKLF